MKDKKAHTKLSDIPKESIHKTPEGYFDELESRIHKKTIEGDAGKIIKFSVEKSVRYIGLAAAASIALIFVFRGMLFNRDTMNNSAETLVSQISARDCMDYLQSLNLETDELMDLTGPETWAELIDEQPVPSAEELDEELLYERFGVTDDEHLQKL
jgi:hypothetical protein